MADVVFGGTVRFMLMFKMLEPLPVFAAYAERLGARPALQRADARNAEVMAQHGLQRQPAAVSRAAPGPRGLTAAPRVDGRRRSARARPKPHRNLEPCAFAHFEPCAFAHFEPCVWLLGAGRRAAGDVQIY